jgi:hypothetical protein
MARTRTGTRSAASLILASILLTVLISGCSWYFYQSEPVPEVLLYDSFDYDLWNGETVERYWMTFFDSPLARGWDTLPGRIVAYDTGNYIQTRDREDRERIEYYTPSFTAGMEWEVTNGNVDLQMLPLPLFDAQDFAIRIDAAGVIADLTLYADGEDRLRLSRESGLLLGEEIIPTAGVTRGTLELDYRIQSGRAYFTARVPELDLEISGETVAPDENDTSVTYGASGLPSDPRALDLVYIYRQSAGVGALP